MHNNGYIERKKKPQALYRLKQKEKKKPQVLYRLKTPTSKHKNQKQKKLYNWLFFFMSNTVQLYNNGYIKRKK